MYYRLSNTAEGKMLEKSFGIPLKYPRLYEPTTVINGLSETTVPIITMEDNQSIDFGIWGLVPKEYKEDWGTFQNTMNTLNIPKEILRSKNWLSLPLEHSRCLILVTGFFASYLVKGSVYPYYVYSQGQMPFCLAGIYNRLEDGFITFSLITVPSNGLVQKVENLSGRMPLIIPEYLKEIWLDQNMPKDDIMNMIDSPQQPNLLAHPIAKELYNRNILYKSMLEPVAYKELPILGPY